MASPGGLSAFLSTLNYGLFLLGWIDVKSAPLQAQLHALLSRFTGRPLSKIAPSAVPAPSPFHALAGLLSTTRTTLRLFGLLPMYAWFRQLMQGPKPGQDPVLYTTSLVQCSAYMSFQFLENVGLLTDHKVLPGSYTERWTASSGGTTAKIFLTAYRCWFAGVLCDFVRLGREWQLRGTDQDIATKESDAERDAKWWSELVVPIGWTPVALHFTKEGGRSWFNLGIMGAAGGAAGLARTISLWKATADE